MSVSVVDNTPAIVRGNQSKITLAIRLMLDDIDADSNGRTPKRYGDLRKNKLKQALGKHGTIIWQQKYAAKQEDVQAAHYTTPGTGPHFAEQGVKTVVEKSGEYFRRVGLI